MLPTSTIGQKANQLMQSFKTKSAPVAGYGSLPINKSPLAITRDQRAAVVQNAPPSLNRQEAIASQSVGRGLSKQQAPRNTQKPLAPDEFLDASGVVRKKMSAGNWKSQQQSQTGQYGGFSKGFTHFVNF